MILLAGAIRFPPANVSAAREAMARMIEATRLEEGCRHYAFGEDVLEPGVIRISELWRDQAALDTHAASTHMREWREAGRDLGVHGGDLRVYEVDEGRPL